jgi:hypothetical protein
MTRDELSVRRRPAAGKSAYRQAISKGLHASKAFQLSMGLATVLAFVAYSGASPAGAAAAACHHQAGSSKWEVCIKGEALGSAGELKTVPFVTKGVTGVRAQFFGTSEMFGNGVPVSCEIQSEGLLRSGAGHVSETEVRYTFKNCEYVGAPYKEDCSINSFVTTNPMIGGFIKNTKVQLESQSGPSGVFLPFKVGNKGSEGCVIWGEYRMSGYFSQSIGEPETEKTTHTLVGIKERTIKILGFNNELTSEQTIELGGTMKGQPFSIIEGS